MQNETDNQYEYDDEDYDYEPRNIRNFIKICRLCDNLKLRHSLIDYKICIYCKNEILALKNSFMLSNIARLYKKKKRLECKRNVVIALSKLNIGIGAGIHQQILDYIL